RRRSVSEAPAHREHGQRASDGGDQLGGGAHGCGRCWRAVDRTGLAQRLGAAFDVARDVLERSLRAVVVHRASASGLFPTTTPLAPEPPCWRELVLRDRNRVGADRSKRKGRAATTSHYDDRRATPSGWTHPRRHANRDCRVLSIEPL